MKRDENKQAVITESEGQNAGPEGTGTRSYQLLNHLLSLNSGCSISAQAKAAPAQDRGRNWNLGGGKSYVRLQR
jgi:hypothetical protein